MLTLINREDIAPDNANELFGNVNDGILPPSGSLNPEISTNANIGVNWRGYTFREHTVRLNTSVFYRDTKGMIRESIRAGSFVYSQFENLEDVLTRGIDAEIFYSYARRLDLSLNISKFDVLFNTEFDANGASYLFYRMQSVMSRPLSTTSTRPGIIRIFF
ncbi:MAG: hypothetical protein ABS46_01735 [Cytophagaceae bacterium SCN 52-12]|nr:MAG: hypothetical protein ABS46_01735 [Cytophagaceae bacterium SCN 52-12]